MSRQDRSAEGGTRERILDIAESVIARNGIDGMRLRDLAGPLGIQVPSIYAHFRGRSDVLTGLVRRYIGSLSEQFPDDGEEEPLAALEQGIRKYSKYLIAHPAFVRLKFRDQEMVGGMPEMDIVAGGTMAENLQSGALSAMYGRVENILKRGIASGTFRPIPVEVFWREVLGLVLVTLTFPATESILEERQSPQKIAATLDEIAEATRRLVIRL
mgnify:CR=1 FL=1